MRGNVIGFDPDRRTGAINGFDGKRYDFGGGDWPGVSRPRRGDLVDFLPEGQRAEQITLIEPERVEPTLGRFYFSTAGRVSRSQYWLRFFLPFLLIGLALNLLQLLDYRTFSVLSSFFGLLVLWPSVALLIKRMHDRDKPGWVIWILYGPMIAAVTFTVSAFYAIGTGSISAAWTTGVTAILLWLTSIAIGFWFLIEFGCMRGTIGANRYGPDPVPHSP